MLIINALGGLAIELDGAPVQLTARVDEALLVYLVGHNRPIPREKLIDLIWQQSSPRQANNNFRSALSRLRRTVGDYLIVSRQAVGFDHSQDYRFDATQFEAVVLELTPFLDRNENLDAAQFGRFQNAIHLYQGNFLSGFALKNSSADFESWVLLTQERLRILASSGLHYLTQHCLAKGELTQGLTYASQLVEVDELNEQAHRQKMWLHVRNRDRSAALRQYQQCEAILAAELKTQPLHATTRLFGRIQHATPDSNNLPRERSPFIGRKQAILDISRHCLTPSTRLVTLTGIGGIGKTRLALAVGNNLAGRLLHGVYFVPLVGVRSPQEVAIALAEAVDIDTSFKADLDAMVVEWLQTRECLVIMDNYEHLLHDEAATDLIERILQAAPDVHLLVTSRETLSLYEETVVVVDGLAQAAPTLFERHAVRMGATPLSADDVVLAAEICTLVEGVPLAVELAAGQAKSNDLHRIMAQILTSVAVLETTMRNVPARQRSLRAVFDYSFGLLSAEYQQSLAKLGLFVGSFAPEAAEALGVPTPHLPQLVAKSLLQPEEEGRFSLHPLIREFALGSLTEAVRGETAHAFSSYYAKEFTHHSKALGRGLTEQSLAAWRLDHANVVEAWRLAVDLRDANLLLRMHTPVGKFHDWRNWYVSAETLFTNAAQALTDWQMSNGCELEAYGDILSRQAWFVYVQGRISEAIGLLSAAKPIIERAGDPQSLNIWHRHYLQMLVKAGRYAEAQQIAENLLADSNPAKTPESHANRLYDSFHLFSATGDYERASAMIAEALEIFEELGDTRRLLMCQYAQGNVARAQGDYETAIHLLRHCVAARENLDDPKRTANAQATLADALYGNGELAEAVALAQAARKTQSENNEKIGLPYSLNVLANVARDQADSERALALYRQALTIALETQRQMKVEELLLDWLILMQPQLDADFYLGGLRAIGESGSAEFETQQRALTVLGQRQANVVPIDLLIARMQSETVRQ